MAPSTIRQTEASVLSDLNKPPLVQAVLQVAEAIHVSKKRTVSERRIEFASQLMSLGNIAAGALLFGQAFSGFPFDFRVASLGLVTLVGLYGFAIYLLKGGRS